MIDSIDRSTKQHIPRKRLQLCVNAPMSEA